jgi:hypothetical protein
MNDPKVERILDYYRGCNSGDIDLMISAFTEDISSFFIDMPPIHGSANLAQFFKMVHEASSARWTLDYTIVTDDDVVAEWSLLFTSPETNIEEFTRGIEVFKFFNDKISEIRQYYRPRYLTQDQIYELQGFPYAERGYPCREDFENRLP